MAEPAHALDARETAGIGAVVAQAVDGASERALALRLAAVSTELERLEARIRAASRIAAEQRTTDRRILVGIAAGVGIVIALLAVLVLRASAGGGGAAASRGCRASAREGAGEE